MATAVCEALWGSTPIITFMTTSLVVVVGHHGGHSCLQTVCAPSSFEPLRGEIQAGGSSFVSQPADAGGRHFVSYPARTSGTLRMNHNVCLHSQAGTTGRPLESRTSNILGHPQSPECRSV